MRYLLSILSGAIICVLLVVCIQSKNGDSFTSKPENREVSTQKTTIIESHIVSHNTAPWKWRTKRITNEENLISQQILSATNVLILGEDGTIYKTANQGETWRQINIERPPDSNVTSLFFGNSSSGWVSIIRRPSDVLDIHGFESWILHTDDGGSSWDVQYSSKALQIKRVLFMSNQEGWAIGSRLVRRETLQNDHFVLHTTDQGKHWTDVSSGLNPDIDGGHVEDIYAVEPSIAILLTSSRKIFSTINGGQTWEQIGVIQGEPPQTAMMRLGMIRNQCLWVLGGTGGREGTWAMLAQKRDDGSWIKYRADGVLLRDVVFLSDTEIVACGTIAAGDRLPLPADDGREGVILHSSDRGRNWFILFRSSKVKAFNDLAAIDSKHIQVVGEGNLILQLERPSINVSSR